MVIPYPLPNHSYIPHLGRRSAKEDNFNKHVNDVQQDVLEKLRNNTTKYKEATDQHRRDHS